MPKRSPHPHVAWRDGRPRFTPGPELRALGHAGRDLRHDDGRWFSRGEAVDWSEAFTRQLADARKVAAPAQPKARAKPATKAPRLPTADARLPLHHLTISELFDQWFRSRKFLRPADDVEARRLEASGAVYKKKSIVDFRQKARVIEQEDPEIWHAPADALSTPAVHGLYEALYARRGIATARGAIAVLSMALAWGRRLGKLTFRENHGANPAQGLGMETPPPRLRIASRAEIEALVTTADARGRPEIGDMILLGLWTGQRQSDRLALEDRGLVAGRRIFRQGKTGAIVAIREAPELARRLAAAAERRRSARAAALLEAEPAERADIERRFSRVILNELIDSRYGKCFWRPYQGQTYGHAFAEIRAIAAKKLPSLADFNEQDLRDTAVTWMATAGATIPEIIAVTGHSPQSATAILKHYLAVNPEMADSAMAKMIAWHAGGGEIEAGF